MKILVLSFYYHPDLCAGSFRCSALIKELIQQPGVEVELITTLPNRYATYTSEAPAHEKRGNLEIHRLSISSHKSGIFDQAKAFPAFYRKARQLSRQKQYDLVFATSSRLFTAFLGAQIASSKSLPLYLDIRDLFVDTMNNVLPSKISWAASPVLKQLERYTFERAKRINLVSPGFEHYFSERYPKQTLRFYTNGIDEEFVKPITPVSALSDRLSVLYAGNIGKGQGLHCIVPQLANKYSDRLNFVIIGDGGQRRELEEAVRGLSNVQLKAPMHRKQLINAYRQADILFLHLNNFPAFKKVLPSKIFEYAAMGKPIWAGVAGYPADFLNREVTNSAVFHPGDAGDAQKAFSQLKLITQERPQFIDKFSRRHIMSAMAQDIVGLGIGK